MKRSFNSCRKAVVVGGVGWMLDEKLLIDRSIMNGGWELPSTAAVRRVVKSEQTALDIGANIGWYTVILSRIVGPKGRVVAFEPMPEPAEITRRHISMNSLSNASLHEIALDDRDHDDEVTFGYAWPLDPLKDPVQQNAALVHFRRLDRVADEIGLSHVDFIKIDVDGYEARLLRGADSVLRRDHPVILLEVCDYTLRWAAGKPQVRKGHPEYGVETRKMIAHLTDIGYRFLDEDTFGPITVDGMVQQYDLSNRSINVVAVHATAAK